MAQNTRKTKCFGRFAHGEQVANKKLSHRDMGFASKHKENKAFWALRRISRDLRRISRTQIFYGWLKTQGKQSVLDGSHMANKLRARNFHAVTWVWLQNKRKKSLLGPSTDKIILLASQAPRPLGIDTIHTKYILPRVAGQVAGSSPRD